MMIRGLFLTLQVYSFTCTYCLLFFMQGGGGVPVKGRFFFVHVILVLFSGFAEYSGGVQHPFSFFFAMSFLMVFWVSVVVSSNMFRYMVFSVLEVCVFD